MVGCNLYRDGVWPIISNDGHLSYVRFKKDVSHRLLPRITAYAQLQLSCVLVLINLKLFPNVFGMYSAT